MKHTDPDGKPITRRPGTAPGGTVAFWVSENEIIENDAAHVRVVMGNPDKFGITGERIRHLYQVHAELPGTEGKARAQIVAEVCRNGWIRVRHYVGAREDYWSIQVDRYEVRKDLILSFIAWALDAHYMTPQESLRITGNDDDTMIGFTFQNGGIAGYLESVTGVT